MKRWLLVLAVLLGASLCGGTASAQYPIGIGFGGGWGGYSYGPRVHVHRPVYVPRVYSAPRVVYARPTISVYSGYGGYAGYGASYYGAGYGLPYTVGYPSFSYSYTPYGVRYSAGYAPHAGCWSY